MSASSVAEERMEQETTSQWHSYSIQKVAESLRTDPSTGLAPSDAGARLTRYGPNELSELPRPGFWQLLLGQFNNFVVIILIVAALVSVALGEYIEAGAIMIIVVLNAVLGVIQESKAEEALAALPAAYRAPLLLYSHYGFKVSEVAEVLGVNEGAVKTRLYRAREMFRRAYDREDHG